MKIWQKWQKNRKFRNFSKSINIDPGSFPRLQKLILNDFEAMGSHLKPFLKMRKFHEKWTPPDATWLKFCVVVMLPRNVKISPGDPLPRLDFLTLLTAKEEDHELGDRTCLDCHPSSCSIQPASRFHFWYFSFIPLYFSSAFLSLLHLVWLRWYSPIWNSATFRLNFFSSFARFRPLFASKTSSSLLTTSYWCSVHEHMPFPGFVRFKFLFNKIF